jgi:hypothetical protein
MEVAVAAVVINKVAVVVAVAVVEGVALLLANQPFPLPPLVLHPKHLPPPQATTTVEVVVAVAAVKIKMVAVVVAVAVVEGVALLLANQPVPLPPLVPRQNHLPPHQATTTMVVVAVAAVVIKMVVVVVAVVVVEGVALLLLNQPVPLRPLVTHPKHLPPPQAMATLAVLVVTVAVAVALFSAHHLVLLCPRSPHFPRFPRLLFHLSFPKISARGVVLGVVEVARAGIC